MVDPTTRMVVLAILAGRDRRAPVLVTGRGPRSAPWWLGSPTRGAAALAGRGAAGDRRARVRGMSRGGPTPRAAPVGWVRLEGRYTFRWRRGDPLAHVLGAQQMGDHGMAGVLDTIPVSPSGWTDLAEIRLVGQRWLHQQRGQQSA